MEILDGKIVSQAIKKQLQDKILSQNNYRPPHLAAVLVGNNGASQTYVASKIKSCREVGFESTLIELPENITTEKLLEQIHRLNNDSNIDGILIQLPLPKSIPENIILQAVDPEKDVDGFHPINSGKLLQGEPTFIPATPFGIMLMLEHYKIQTSGKHAVVLGRSNIVGKPISVLLSRNAEPGNCTVTICHSRSQHVKDICRQADIIVAAIGKPRFLTADMVKEGAVVIDVGINRMPNDTKKSGYEIVGDVDFDPVSVKCSYITPVPGGVGPMTIAALMMNTYRSRNRRLGISDQSFNL
jgi:methylenetetrahydrofolate dehydrogenase (NADP+)/methenyltetrahydrofolate cyclohydrolase